MKSFDEEGSFVVFATRGQSRLLIRNNWIARLMQNPINEIVERAHHMGFSVLFATSRAAISFATIN